MAQAAPAAAPPQGAAAGGLPGFDFDNLVGPRSAEDILQGVVRVRLGRKEHVLAVLSIGANRRWKAGLEGYLTGLLGAVEKAGDELADVLSAFTTSTDDFLTVLYAYDRAHDAQGQATQPGVLPPREALEEVATDAEVLLATLGVWSAANPFAAVALSAMRAADAVPAPSISGPPANGSPTPTSSARPNTGGRRRRSKPS